MNPLKRVAKELSDFKSEKNDNIISVICDVINIFDSNLIVLNTTTSHIEISFSNGIG